jgi:hypothetical protein
VKFAALLLLENQEHLLKIKDVNLKAPSAHSEQTALRTGETLQGIPGKGLGSRIRKEL